MPSCSRAIVRVLVVTVVAGSLAGLLLSWRRHPAGGRSGRRGRMHLGPALAGAGGALAMGVVALGSVWASYRTTAFGEPRYTGALERAPAVIDAVKREFGDLAGMRGRLKVLAGQINELSQVATGTQPAADPHEVRILHISDVHLNPLGLEIARNLADTFAVEAVLDTGDLTSFGLDGESRIGALVNQFDVPYYLVPGNHDSPENRAALARHANLTVLDGEVVDIGGVRVLGVADPGFTGLGGITRDAAAGLRDDEADEVASMVRRHRPDVLAVAGLAMADQSMGEVPLVLSGDIHERSSSRGVGHAGAHRRIDRRHRVGVVHGGGGSPLRGRGPPLRRWAAGHPRLRDHEGSDGRLLGRPGGLRRRLSRPWPWTQKS